MKNHKSEIDYFVKGGSVDHKETVRMIREVFVLRKLEEMTEEKKTRTEVENDRRGNLTKTRTFTLDGKLQKEEEYNNKGEKIAIKIFGLDGKIAFFEDLAEIERLSNELVEKEELLDSSLKDRS